MKVLIVESPNKKKTIQKYLGSGFDVHATAGHFRDLPARDLGIDLQSFEPTYVVDDEKAGLLAGIRKAVKDADEVFLATDADREGEAISWHLLDELKLKKAKRIRFTEITPNALKAAIAAATSVDQNLVDAQQARRIIDRLVGYQLSPLLSPFGKGHSAGRVQSATLHMVVTRELEREAHSATPYWVLTAKYANGLIAKFAPQKSDDDEDVRIQSEEEAKAILDRARGPHLVAGIDTKPGERKPKAPFITSTLQRAASGTLKLKPDATMKAAQELFEGGHISYHRTDSVSVSDDAAAMAREFIEKTFPDALPATRPVYKSKSTAQGAHECIRPTSLEHDVPEGVSGDAAKLYAIIRTRFIASQCAPAKVSKTVITLTAADTTWRASGTTILAPGFLRVGAVDEDADDESGSEQTLPAVTQGEQLEATSLDSKRNETKPPPRYTQATLIAAMEKAGIGRPATYASGVATLFAREYVAEEKQFVFPTERGRLIDSVLTAGFPDLVATNYTSNLEEIFDDVAEGKRAWRTELGLWYRPWETSLAAAAKLFAAEAAKRPELANADAPKPTGKPCPECGKELFLRKGTKGPFLSCSGYPQCKYAADPSAKPSTHKCPKCSSAMQEFEGKYGPYARCVSSTCKHILDLRVAKVHSEKCPKCGGVMHERDGQHGPYARCQTETCKHLVDLKPPPEEKCPVCSGDMRDKGDFLSCAKYPDCRGKWDKKALRDAKKLNRSCPECKTRLLVPRKGDKGEYLACSGFPACKHIDKAAEKAAPKKKAAGGRR